MSRLIALLLFALQPLQSFGQNVDVAILPRREGYVIGEPVILRCVLTNSSNQPTVIDLGTNDEMNVSFVLKLKDGRGENLPLSYRGRAVSLPGTVEIEAYGKASRFVVLDRYFHPSMPGVFTLEFVTGQLRAPFEIKVGATDNEKLRQGVNRIVDKYYAMMSDISHGSHDEIWEVLHYKYAMITAFSYLAEAPNAIWRDVRKRYGQTMLSLFEASKKMSPSRSDSAD